MNEMTVRGNIITDPSSRRVGDDPVFSFRVASNTRYQDRDTNEWKTGSTLYFTATCWGWLAEKAAGKLVKGDAVIVSGRLLTNEYERDGTVRRDLEMRVSGLGPDMARMDVTVRRFKGEEVPLPAEPGAEGEGELDESTHAISPVDGSAADGTGSDDSDMDASGGVGSGLVGALAGSLRR